MADSNHTRLLCVSKTYPLTFALVDDCDYEFLSQWNWWINSEGYVIRHTQINGKQHTRRLARIVADAPDSVIVDHINGNPLDNRRENLRYANSRQNSINRCQAKDKRFKGVYKNSNARTYTARIRVEGKPIYLGSFHSEEAAARAYDAAALEHFGEFARLNFPDKAA